MRTVSAYDGRTYVGFSVIDGKGRPQEHLDEDVEPTIDALLLRSATGGPVRYRSLRRSFGAACRRLGLRPVPRWICSPRDAYSSMSEQYIGMVGDGSQEHEADVDLVGRHLSGLAGPVIDLGCGPGHWTSYLHSLGADVTGVDMVPEFVGHARATYPGIDCQEGSMTELGLPDHSVAGILSWYSTIHLTPSALTHRGR